MTINFNVPYCTIIGDQVIDPVTKEKLALKTIIVNTLQNPITAADGEQMLKRYELAKKIFAETGDFELKELERELIMKAVRESGNTLAYGVLTDLFNKG